MNQLLTHLHYKTQHLCCNTNITPEFDLCEVADLAAQFILHSVDGTLELDQLSVQEAGVVFVFRKLQNDSTCRAIDQINEQV